MKNSIFSSCFLYKTYRLFFSVLCIAFLIHCYNMVGLYAFLEQKGDVVTKDIISMTSLWVVLLANSALMLLYLRRREERRKASEGEKEPLKADGVR